MRAAAAALSGIVVAFVALPLRAESTRPLLPPARSEPIWGPDALMRAKNLDGAQLLRLPSAERQAIGQALADDSSLHTLGHLWLLAHDSDPEVQASALVAALIRCPHEPQSVCGAMIRFFVDEHDSETTWAARTALLKADPSAALKAAQRSYKLEVLSLIAGRIGLATIAQGHMQALDVLALDADPEVQQVAGMVLLELNR